jgi:hypothetical protein
MNTHSTSTTTTAEDTMTLGELPSVIGDDSEYVFVDSDEEDDFDDDEYDHITDLSPVISCDGSIATEVTDLKSLIDEGVALVDNSSDNDHADNNATNTILAAATKGRRVSNKKRRKMLKMMKKAAAAAAAKEALEAMSSSTSSEETTQRGGGGGGADSSRRAARRARSNSGGSSYKERKARASKNFQVACAQQALANYRKETEAAANDVF